MRPSVIIADDDPFITQLLSEICDSERMDVRIASDGEEVMAMLLDSPPDLILLDIMMPKMNGFHVLEEMSCMPPMRNVAVIVISAVTDNESVRKCYQLGAQDYFFKPFRVGELLSRLRSHLKAAAYRNLPGEPLDHEVGDDSQIAQELRRQLECPRRRPVSVMSVTLEGRDSEAIPRSTRVELCKLLRLQMRLVDRLFLLGDNRVVLVLPSTDTRGMEALQERLGEHLLDLLQQHKLAESVTLAWGRDAVVPGAAPEGWVEQLLVEPE